MKMSDAGKFMVFTLLVSSALCMTNTEEDLSPEEQAAKDDVDQPTPSPHFLSPAPGEDVPFHAWDTSREGSCKRTGRDGQTRNWCGRALCACGSAMLGEFHFDRCNQRNGDVHQLCKDNGCLPSQCVEIVSVKENKHKCVYPVAPKVVVKQGEGQRLVCDHKLKQISCEPGGLYKKDTLSCGVLKDQFDPGNTDKMLECTCDHSCVFRAPGTIYSCCKDYVAECHDCDIIFSMIHPTDETQCLQQIIRAKNYVQNECKEIMDDEERTCKAAVAISEDNFDCADIPNLNPGPNNITTSYCELFDLQNDYFKANCGQQFEQVKQTCSKIFKSDTNVDDETTCEDLQSTSDSGQQLPALICQHAKNVGEKEAMTCAELENMECNNVEHCFKKKDLANECCITCRNLANKVKDIKDNCQSTPEYCNGVCNPRAKLDCAGTCDGKEQADSCGICGGDGTACVDCKVQPGYCNGICKAPATVDKCGVCGGNGKSCENCAGVVDCAGVCNGDAKKDSCGKCGGDGSICVDCYVTTQFCNGICKPKATKDCNGICGGGSMLDSCGVCGGDGQTCSKNANVSDKQPSNPGGLSQGAIIAIVAIGVVILVTIIGGVIAVVVMKAKERQAGQRVFDESDLTNIGSVPGSNNFASGVGFDSPAQDLREQYDTRSPRTSSRSPRKKNSARNRERRARREQRRSRHTSRRGRFDDDNGDGTINL